VCPPLRGVFFSGGIKMAEKKKVLLVDDSNTVLLMEKMMLREGGYEVVTARNGVEAVEKARVERPDLILLDVIMPEMNGFEACRRIRAMEATKSVPIIMVTTRSEETFVRSGYESGCNEYITKPFSSVELLSKLRRYLEG
jgi:CheY-like chemotaxis protein